MLLIITTVNKIIGMSKYQYYQYQYQWYWPALVLAGIGIGIGSSTDIVISIGIGAHILLMSLIQSISFRHPKHLEAIFVFLCLSSPPYTKFFTTNGNGKYNSSFPHHETTILSRHGFTRELDQNVFGGEESESGVRWWEICI